MFLWIRTLLDEYNIRIDPQQNVPTDNAKVENVFAVLLISMYSYM